MKKTSIVIILLTFYNLCFSQKEEILQKDYLLKVNHYSLDLSFDFQESYLSGVCDVTIENKSDKPINEIPFLLYRLMKVISVQNQQGKEINFVQSIVSFSDFEKLQTNSITINEFINPKSTTTFKIKYEGYLFGYQETGMQYITDKISPDFTLIRNDAYSYPILAKPSIAFLRKNIASNNFTYDVSVVVPDSLIVANGGTLVSKITESRNTTYKYKSKKPNWRIDIAIAPYKFETTDRLDVFYFPSDSENARTLLSRGYETLKLYTQWWGTLKNNNSITLIETEKNSGGQADETTILLPQESFSSGAYFQLYHELSHLWNITISEKEGLSPRWEEGLASFCQYYADEHFNPEKKGLLDKIVNRAIKRLKINFDATPEMYNIPMCEFGNESVTGYSYDQGMIMFTVLHKWLGKEKFNLAIRFFYEKYYATGATTKNFTELWIKETKTKGLKDFFNDWVYTTNYTSFVKNENTIDEIVKYYNKEEK